jgi:gliding motility-associated-like protein
MKYTLLWLIFTIIGYVTYAQQEIELCPGYKTNFTYWSNSSTSTGGWLWILNSQVISHNNSVVINWSDTGFYLIKVSYADECGNPSRFYSVRVKKCPESAIFFPNAFTPTGDGLNDSWSPIPFKIIEIKWQIYNRWGEKVFESYRVGQKWDGTFKGVKQPIGNFVFICWWKGIDGKQGFRKGNLLLIR